MNCRIFNNKCFNYFIEAFVLLCGLGIIVTLICLTVFGCNNPTLRKITNKPISTRVLTKPFDMLSQDCLFTEVIENDLCVDTGVDTDIIENGNYITHNNSLVRKYTQGDEFCISIKNTNLVYSCDEKPAYVLITPTMFKSTSRYNNVVLTTLIGSAGILAYTFIVLYFTQTLYIDFVKYVLNKVGFKLTRNVKETIPDEELGKQDSSKTTVPQTTVPQTTVPEIVPLESPILDENELKELEKEKHKHCKVYKNNVTPNSIHKNKLSKTEIQKDKNKEKLSKSEV